MKNLFAVTLILASIITKNSFAQSDEHRNKIQMVVAYQGKTITTDLNSLSTSISRTSDEEAPVLKSTADTSKAASKLPVGLPPAFYLTMDAKQIDTELIKLFAKKQTRFDGTITVTDTYGKNQPKVIKFKQATLYNYSDQFSAASYGDSYGNAVVSITCKEVAINGVNIEQ